MTKFLTILGAAACLSLAAPAAAQERGAVRHDFDATQVQGDARILVFRPRIRVGEQSTGGMFEPRADWTELARDNLGNALDAYQVRYGSTLVEAPEAFGEDARIVEDYMALFSTVAESIVSYQFFPGNRLETKKADNRNEVFDWTLGPGVKDLPGAENADYALFVNTEDHYGSTGRKVLQVFAAMGGVSVTSGRHAGFAALVDLETGNILWVNADMQMGGDVREVDGAQRRVEQLFEDFPLVPAAAAGE
ncbi:hypothetical protein [Aurantiacibacter zhengii]|uniref:DUF4136 domain-containing protein n=1 Tax=Aurantiacibacter zhengii TaxID=2307003 RepID=A0A418NVL9_9SPHN|nr:hypothetical protein [Aurantiacibacter zhengii]RIV88054.1 hypothetical protein D2V07_04795 [Aurantiacibacter zhengii]